MRRFSISLLLSAILICISSGLALGQGREVIEAGKRATAIVEIPELKSLGSAFCIHESGLFVTNHHVVEKLDAKKTLRVVIDPSLPTEKALQAKVLRTDQKSDLAILKVEPGEIKFTPIKLSNDESLYETMSIAAFGYPFGKSLALEKGSYPSISVNTGRITSLRREKGVMQLIQIDAALNPGNSGGPIIGDSGQVIGIVSFGVASSGVNFAIPVDKLRTLLETPHIQAKTPDFRQLSKAFGKTIELSLTPLADRLPEPSVELLIKYGNSSERRIEMKPSQDDRYESTLEPEEGFNMANKMLTAKIEFEQGRLEANLVNEKIPAIGGDVWLSEVMQIEVAVTSKPKFAIVTLRTGEIIEVEKSKLPKVKIDFGNYPATIVLSRISNIQVDDIPEKEATLTFVVKSAGKEILRRTSSEMLEDGSLVISNDTSRSAIKPLKTGGVAPISSSSIPKSVAQDLLAEKKSIAMPGTISDVTFAGGGKLLAITMASDKQLVFLDVAKQKIVKTISLESPSIQVVGMMNYFVLVDPEKRTLERYELSTFNREVTMTFPFDGIVKAVSAGSASQGPLLFLIADNPKQYAKCSFVTVDLASLKEIKSQSLEEFRINDFSNPESVAHLRGSADGSVFGLWGSGMGAIGLHSLRLHNKSISCNSYQQHRGFVVPSSNGTQLLTEHAGLVDVELTQQDRIRFSHTALTPTSHPRLHVNLEQTTNTDKIPAEKYYVGTLMAMGSNIPLVNLPNLDLTLTNDRLEPEHTELTLDKRVHVLIGDNLMATVPFSNDRVVVQGFNLRNALRAGAINHFFVASSAPRTFTLGERLSYPIQIETNQKRVVFELTDGPSGMEISDTGIITWNVPNNFAEPKVDVIVSISSGESYHMFEMFTIDRKN